ncbi:MAG: carbon-nitrogen hydrolase family protein [Actinomycetota bacterium]|nr:carbon-nitrogen hydrolase family protein [Actinomycetota bacterium]
MRTLSIAALQTAPVAGDREATLDRFAAEAAAVRRTIPHAELLLVPELHLSAPPGLLDEHDCYAEEAAVEIPGPLTERLGEIASATGLWLVPGSVYERAGERIHNTALAISPQGELVATYRKAFPWQPLETTSPGDRFVTFEIPGIARVGLAICYDGFFPEAFRQLAWMGAEIVLQTTLTTTSDRSAELVTARANAIFNQLYVVNVNAASPAALGRSLVIDPEGHVRVQAGSGPELITDVVDLDAVTRVRRFGTAGVSRMWAQLDAGEAAELELPMYGSGGIRPRDTDRAARPDA